MNGVNYLLQTNLYLLLFMGFYVLVLRNETFFRQNRFFLNTSIFLSFVIPFMNSDWFRDLFITQKVREAAIMPSQMIYEIVVSGSEGASVWTASEIIFTVYTTGAMFLLIRFFVRLVLLRSKLKVEKGAAFSFFNTMVVDKDMAKVGTVIDHEKVHMRQWHSADIIFIELAAIINWFNPIMYLYKKEIRHIHEFIADDEAANLMQSKSDYALLLFSNTLGVDPLHLSNNFFNKSLLKRRIIMLHKTKSRRTGLWKYGFSAPLFILMLIVSAATVQSEEVIIRPMAETILSPLPAETSREIISTLEIDKRAPENMKEETSGAKTQEAERADPDFSILMKYVQKNIKYPAATRQNKVAGLVIATFNIKNKEITGANVIKGLQTDANGEVLRTLTSFRDQINAPDDTYTIAIKYTLMGTGAPRDFIPGQDVRNYIGQIIVTAMQPEATPDVRNPTSGDTQAKDVTNTDNGMKDFASVDLLPEFAGGMNGWGQYLQANLKYPAEARKARITGRVIMAFVVEKDGSLSEIKVVRGVGSGLDEEAMRVLTNSPKWKPGIDNERPVRVAYTMPIFFQLAPEPDKKP